MRPDKYKTIWGWRQPAKQDAYTEHIMSGRPKVEFQANVPKPIRFLWPDCKTGDGQYGPWFSWNVECIDQPWRETPQATSSDFVIGGKLTS